MGKRDKNDKFYQYARKRILDHKTRTGWRGYLQGDVILKEISVNFFGGRKLIGFSPAWWKHKNKIKQARVSVRNKKYYLKKQAIEWAPNIGCSEYIISQLMAEKLLQSTEDAKKLKKILTIILSDIIPIGLKNYDKLNLSKIMKTIF